MDSTSKSFILGRVSQVDTHWYLIVNADESSFNRSVKNQYSSFPANSSSVIIYDRLKEGVSDIEHIK